MMDTFKVICHVGDSPRIYTLQARNSAMLKSIIRRIQYDKSKSIYINEVKLVGVEGKL